MEESLIQLLLADSGLSALVSTRVYPGSRPQGSALPAVVLNRISGGPGYADDGETGLTNTRIQIDCWAATYGQAKLVARAVTASLSDFQGTIGNTVFCSVMLEDERDLREGGGNVPENPFRTSLDFDVWAET
jgi:hypothetical protein